MLEIIPALPEHVRELGQNLREADQREIRAGGHEPHRSLWKCYKQSLIRKTIMLEGRVAAMFGCKGNIFESVGIPWFLTSPHVEEVSPLTFAFLYRQEVKEMIKLFPVLVNFVHAEYHDSVRLLKLVGFKLGDPEPQGPHNELFQKFEMRMQ